MINAFIDNGEMKVGEFQKAIGVSGSSYRMFMGKHGAYKGAESDTYMEAWEFFKKREMQGKGLPRKKAKAATSKGSTAGAAKSNGAKIPGSETAGGKDLSNIHLDGEEHDSVPVLDTCDEIRKKINAHMKKDNVVQAAFLRDMQAQYHTDKAPQKIRSSQLDRFRSTKGARNGNTSSVHYGAYCFFEKLRIAEGKPKSKHRKEMEGIHGAEGMDVTHDISRGILCTPRMVPTIDQYGRLDMHRR